MDPDQLGKSRKHWDNLHMKMQLRLLRARLSEKEEEGRIRVRRREGPCFCLQGRR
jgi:hypothetical protein